MDLWITRGDHCQNLSTTWSLLLFLYLILSTSKMDQQGKEVGSWNSALIDSSKVHVGDRIKFGFCLCFKLWLINQSHFKIFFFQSIVCVNLKLMFNFCRIKNSFYYGLVTLENVGLMVLWWYSDATFIGLHKYVFIIIYVVLQLLGFVLLLFYYKKMHPNKNLPDKLQTAHFLWSRAQKL